MKVLNDRKRRSQTLLEVPSTKFENYFDYYVFIHLNTRVQIMHVTGMLLGLLFLYLAIVHLSWTFLILHLICFNIIPLASHWIFDGIHTPTATGALFVSIWFAIKINMWLLTGQQKKKESQFILKYPFAEAYFRN